jgi:hypothetical protein
MKIVVRSEKANIGWGDVQHSLYFESRAPEEL